MFKQLANLQEGVQRSETEPVFLFKHSSTCPISFYAKEEVEKFLGKTNATAYMVTVQEERPLSNEIAQSLSVTHQSPQVICLKDGEVRDSYSHYSIKAETLENVYQEMQ